MPDKIKPLVSIIVNCHNGETYLKDCLTSIMNQTYKNWELIFWDNFSKDNSKKILNNFSDSRIKYYHSDTFTPLYEARNLALKKATGDFISFLDTDDWWVPNKIEKQMDVFLKNNNLDIVYSNCYFFYNKTKKKKIFSKNLPVGKITQQLLNNYNIAGILTALCKKRVFKKQNFVGKYEIIGDFDFFIKVSFVCSFDCVDEPLAYYRIHDFNTSLKKIHTQVNELENWVSFNKFKDDFRDYSFNGVYFVLQTLKIKKSFLDGERIKALKEIITPPLNFKKLKFLLLFFIPKNKIEFFIN